MSEFTLSFIWYLVIGVAVIFYVALDGFDLGVGIMNFFTKKDDERRIFLNSIGPVWDGNEVWLVIVGGALFAGFPDVYATLFSGFYNLCMILLAGLIFRAVAIEFRSKRKSMKWRSIWDAVFSVSSLLISFGLGVTLGNLIIGIPLNENGDFVGSFALFFRPFPILIGLFTISLLMMHGSIYLAMKTEGALHKRLRVWAKRCIMIFVGFYVVTTVATWIGAPHMFERFRENPWFLVVPLLALLSILNVPRMFTRNSDGWAFLSSCGCILLLFCVFGIGTFPYLVRSTINPDTASLTFFNSSASVLTLKVLLIIVAIGVPLVLAYGTMIYRVFRGKVKLEKSSY
ncbi:MAG: cytochrome d ubiquinol oxidase subunit II [Verrucomicrobia bacterium]|nr:cytochrome d ubiquinol oxidase subunit II [Verrucomicrobiota bacterium]